MENVKEITFDIKGDERGSLVAIQGQIDIEFPIERIYYIYDTDAGLTRGYHAHKAQKQILVCLAGKCDIKFNNGKETKVIEFEQPNKGVYLTGVVWREIFNMSKNCVLLSIVNTKYDEDDYIRNYPQFLEVVKTTI